MVLNTFNDFQVHGILSRYWAGEGSPLVAPHRHNEIELNWLGGGGKLRYSIAGRLVNVPAGALTVFWAGYSHHIAEWKPGSILWSFSVPMTVFLHWPLPEAGFVHPLMRGEVIQETDASQSGPDEELVSRWHRDLGSTSHGSEMEEIVLLELEARIRRLAWGKHAPLAKPVHRHQSERIAVMLQYIAAHHTEPISVADIARAAKSNPSHAMELFRRSCGVSMMNYVNTQRISYAQRLLQNSDAKIVDVALEAGFGSLSQFHEVFRKVTGQSPREYARKLPGR